MNTKQSLPAAIREMVRQKPNLSLSSKRNYMIAALQFERTLGSKAIGRITAKDLEEHAARRQAAGRAPGTINLELRVAALIFKRHKLLVEDRR